MTTQVCSSRNVIPGQLEIDVAYTLEDTRSSTLLRRIAEKKSFDVVPLNYTLRDIWRFFDAVLMQAWHFFVPMIDKFCQLLRSMDIRTSPVCPLVRNHGDS